MDKSTASFIQSLCLGEIEEDIILPFPTMPAAERETLQTVLETIDKMLEAHQKHFRVWDNAGEFPPAFIEEMKQMGMFGLVIPEEHGGLGFNAQAYSRALQEVARFDGAVAVTIGAHSSIGMRGLLLFGNDEQKKRYYPKLVTGEMIAAFCLTEPSAGSDAASIKTTATKDGDDWVLSGSKLWITNGGIAQFFTVFAKTGPQDHKGNITAFIVERDMKGVSVGPHEDKMGQRASSTTEVFFDNVRVPSQNVLGEVGKGFKVAMRILNSGRSGLGGGTVGAMKSCIALSTKQAKERKQFGKSIAEYGLIKQKVGHMVVECFATESVVSMVAGLVDQGYEDYAVESAISKIFGSECMWRTADEALQIAGGNGFMRDFPYERILRDARIARIYEGTNDILRLFVALTGMNDVGQQLKELSASLRGVFSDPIKGFGVLSGYAKKHASLVTGVNREKSRFTKLAPPLRPQAQIFEDGTRDLAAAADRILRKHGRNIIEKQFATKRLADIMIDLYVLACMLSRVHSLVASKGVDANAKEMEILKVFAGQVGRRVRSNFGKIDDNDDELIKSLADHAFEREGYGWDTVAS